MKNKKSKLKRIISGFSVGVAATGAVIPVIACGDDDESNIVSVSAAVQNDLLKVSANLDGFSELPEIPEHTHWEFKVNDGGSFSAELPATFADGDKDTIKLVADEGYELEGEAEYEITVRDVVDTSGLQAALDSLTISTLDTEITLPEAPTHTHWEYKKNNEAFADSAPDLSSLTPKDKLTIKLFFDENYEGNTDEPVERTGIPVEAKLDTTYFQGALDDLEGHFTVNTQTVDIEMQDPNDDTKKVKAVPPGYNLDNPDLSYSWWEYKVQEDDDWTPIQNDNPSTIDLSSYTLSTDETISVRLAKKDDYALSTGAVEREYHVVAKVNTTGFQEALDKFVIQQDTIIKPDNGVLSLPVISSNIADEVKWEYQFNGEGNWLLAENNTIDVGKSAPKLGDKLAIRLNLGDNYTATTTEPITKTYDVVKVVDTATDAEQLPKLANPLVNQTDFTLPDLVDEKNTRWQYKVDDGEFKDLTGTVIDVTKMGWKRGSKVTIHLNFNGNYVPSNTVEDKLVTVVEKVDTSDAKEGLAKLKNPDSAQTDYTLPNLPDADHTRWKYSTDDGKTFKDLTDTVIDVTKMGWAVGQKLQIKLNLDTNYESSAGNIERTDFVVQHTFDTKKLKEDLQGLAGPIVGQKNFTLPEVPDTTNTHWQYSTDDGKSFKDLVDKDGKATTVINAGDQETGWKDGDTLRIKLFLEPNYLSSETEVSKNFTATTIVNVPDGFNDAFEKTEADHEAGFVGLPDLKEGEFKMDNVHYTYTVNDGTPTDTQPTDDQLTAGKKIVINLVADENYRLSETVAPVTINAIQELATGPVDDWNKKMNDANFVYGNKDFANQIPVAPVGSRWEYTAADHNPQETPFDDLSVGDEFHVSLKIDEYWHLPSTTGGVDFETEKNYTVEAQSVNVVADFQAALDSTSATAADGIKNLPDIKEGEFKMDHTHYTYKVADEPATNTEPDSLTKGQEVVITFEADENYKLSATVNPVTFTVG